MKNRWRVERTGSPLGQGYGRGWMAMNLTTGVGAWFPTWEEAFGFAVEEAFAAAAAAEPLPLILPNGDVYTARATAAQARAFELHWGGELIAD